MSKSVVRRLSIQMDDDELAKFLAQAIKIEVLMQAVMMDRCFECGSINVVESGTLATGRVIVDGVDIGQDYHLCEQHKPKDGQPQSCKQVEFYWPAGS